MKAKFHLQKKCGLQVIDGGRIVNDYLKQKIHIFGKPDTVHFPGDNHAYTATFIKEEYPDYEVTYGNEEVLDKAHQLY